MTDRMAEETAVLGRLTAPVRNRYFYGKMLDSFFLDMEQAWVRRMLAMRNRLADGTGVRTGLEVVASADRTLLRVGAGVAADHVGRDLVVTDWSEPLDPRQPSGPDGRPAGPRIDGVGQVTLYLSYDACQTHPVRVLLDECGPSRAVAPGAVREQYRLWVRAGLPDAQPGLLTDEQADEVFPRELLDPFDRRRAATVALASRWSAPADSAVVLATVDLAADGTIASIDPFSYRSVVYSNAVLLDLILALAGRVDACCDAGLRLRVVAGNGQSGAPGATLDRSVTVLVSRAGEPVEDEPVTFEAGEGAGSIGETPGELGHVLTTRTGPDGRATLPVWQLGQGDGRQTVTARVGGEEAVSITLTATALAAPGLPVLRAIWPPNAATLGRSTGTTGFASWQREPRLELTFDREPAADRLGAPAPWLRVWQLGRTDGRSPLSEPRDNAFELTPVALAYEGAGASALGMDGFTAVYRLARGAASPAGRFAAYLVQIRADDANSGTIVDTSTPPVAVDADWRGATLDDAQLDALWNVSAPLVGSDAPAELQNLAEALVPTEEPLPSGDGTPGGVFTSWFLVARPGR